MKRLLLTSTLEGFGPKLPLIFGNDLSKLNVLCIPTAAYAEDGYEEWLPAEQAAFKSAAKSYKEFDIAKKSNQELTNALTDIDILYVTGGNTFCLLDAMKKITFSEVLTEFFERGGIYVGSSAGSVVMCPDIKFASAMDQPEKAKLSNTESLAYIPFSLIPHLDHPSLAKHVDNCVADAKKLGFPVIGLRDDQALWVVDDYVQIY